MASADDRPGAGLPRIRVPIDRDHPLRLRLTVAAVASFRCACFFKGGGVILRAACLAGAVVLFGSCDAVESGPDYVKTRASLSPAAAPSSRPGESCDAHGRSDCFSGLCFATQMAKGAGHVCTVVCETDADCFEEWSCGTVAPRTRVCVPRPDWRPRAAIARARGQSSVRSVPDAGLGGLGASSAQLDVGDGGQ